MVAGAATSTGYGTSYRSGAAGQALLQRGKQPGGTGLVSRACSGMGAPVQHMFTSSHSDPALTGLIWRAASGSSSAGNPGTPGVSSQVFYPHISAALAATTCTKQELHPSVLMTQSLFFM